ncbi:hypothetical protein HW090_02995 [Pseudomonas sp. ABC1]|uniref:hypothetical protein n=1 Tax=Pseudomonas sp. ABC1 TaxID=2748080 RepID=UPI0015C36CDB|nr:hypothetical protein [Pseudomonas sp. ABC1]QLF92224.1 hypothetical protein HW090_02995 [Pseudomonas sp. ABC1]
MAEHPDSIRPDQDEIRTYHHTHRIRSQGISQGNAIVLAAIIGIGGFWGGKIAYDRFQEWRVEQALKEFAQQLEIADRKARLEQQRRQQAAQRQVQAHREQKRQQAIAAEKARYDEVWNSRACKFWWEHDPKNPAVIAKARTMQTCKS